jgi:hypothetical protein
MTNKELFEKIISQELTFDLKGHYFDVERYKKDVRDFYFMSITDTDLKYFFDKDLSQRNNVVGGLFYPGIKCRTCGQPIYFKLDEEKKTLSCSHSFDIINRKLENIEIGRCEFENIKSFKGKINVSSPLVIANYFPEFPDCDEEDKHSDEYCLNTLTGRKNITEYKSKKLNIAYGQMGNMAISIYLSPDKKEIILGDYGGLLDENEIVYENCKQYENYEFIGDISLPIWRWEASDLNTIKNIPSTEDEIDSTEEEIDSVIIDVPFGEWEFEHFYGITEESYDSFVYARLKLKE